VHAISREGLRELEAIREPSFDVGDGDGRAAAKGFMTRRGLN
jgi:hypothetical protein